MPLREGSARATKSFARKTFNACSMGPFPDMAPRNGRIAQNLGRARGRRAEGPAADHGLSYGPG
ncbi:predicted protein [Streptomyces filamentosus NRRL 15998]|uniref:Predicted protein n=1 Tax=Streptomyces filamentosus NRRL 15998 TaxID=457431 RepID=D6AN90_STRFL|nr:predicted protein [Streptomyces filamentosus NRRL 15998]